MGCLKRPAKFLFFKYFKDHDWLITRVYKFMRYVGNDYKVDEKCQYCGLRRERSFVTPDELLVKGFTVEQLEEANGRE